jgi:ATP-dependent Clp protease ATP-binding subunit ClpC
MNGYNFTERVRKVLMLAREEAIALQHEYVGTEHILLGIIAEGGGVANASLDSLGVDQDRVRDEVLTTVKRGTTDYGVSRVDLPYTSRAKKVLELAVQSARNLNHSYVGTEHLLLGLIREERGIAAQILLSCGVTPAKLQDDVIRLIGAESPTTSGPVPGHTARERERQAAITVVIEHPDGRVEARKFHSSSDATTFLNTLEY